MKWITSGSGGGAACFSSDPFNFNFPTTVFSARSTFLAAVVMTAAGLGVAGACGGGVAAVVAVVNDDCAWLQRASKERTCPSSSSRFEAT